MHYIVIYQQNGDRMVTIDSVTPLHPMHNRHIHTYRIKVTVPSQLWRKMFHVKISDNASFSL